MEYTVIPVEDMYKIVLSNNGSKVTFGYYLPKQLAEAEKSVKASIASYIKGRTKTINANSHRVKLVDGKFVRA